VCSLWKDLKHLPSTTDSWIGDNSRVRVCGSEVTVGCNYLTKEASERGKQWIAGVEEEWKCIGRSGISTGSLLVEDVKGLLHEGIYGRKFLIGRRHGEQLR
jgi:hypothetical protein